LVYSGADGRSRCCPSSPRSQQRKLTALRGPHNRHEIRIGPVNALATVGRIWPSMADRIIARELAAAEKPASVDN